MPLGVFMMSCKLPSSIIVEQVGVAVPDLLDPLDAHAGRFEPFGRAPGGQEVIDQLVELRGQRHEAFPKGKSIPPSVGRGA